MSTKSRTVLFDILAGVIIFVVACTLLGYLDAGVALFVFAPVPVIAGFLRTRSTGIEPLVKALLMSLLFFLFLLPVINGMFHLLVFPFASITGVLLGVHFRKSGSSGRPIAILLSAVYSAAILFLSFYLFPLFFDARMWIDEVKAAPSEYRFVSAKGDTITNRNLDKKVVVLDFWASWCGPCKKEFPELEKIYTKYKNNVDVAFFAVNVDGRRETKEKAINFISESRLRLPFVFDIRTSTAKKFKVQALPTIVIIDKHGLIRYTHQGYEGSENLEKMICSKLDALLK